MKNMTNYLITNAKLISPKGIQKKAAVSIQDGKIHKIFEEYPDKKLGNAQVIDISGNFLSPGFVETHMHGCIDFDFLECTENEFIQMQEFLISKGVTSHLASISSEESGLMLERIKFLAGLGEKGKLPGNFLGIHVEGPFINPIKRGSHLKERVRNPDLEEIQRFIEAGKGWIKKVTLAVELPSANELIRFLLNRGVLVSAGHTYASLDEANSSFSNGVNHITHFFNSMREFNYRDPSIVEASLLNDNVSVELILDGFHVHKESARLVIKIKQTDNVILVSDANQAAGLPEGVYFRPGNRKIIVKDGCARLESGNLAGSVILLDDAVRNVERLLSLDFTEAIKMASENPAKSIGVHKRKGKLEAGYDADLIVFDKDVNILLTMINGNLAMNKLGTME